VKQTKTQWTVADVKDAFEYVKDTVQVNVYFMPKEEDTEFERLSIQAIGLGELGENVIDIFVEEEE
tara:strand:- start:3782 stop:3979 length:198 start_codon:yes stop_codon:yes gene_type:complete